MTETNPMLTEHFSLKELTYSKTADEHRISNSIPNQLVLDSLRFTAAGLERIRATLGFPLKITSGYRCTVLNKLVGGAPDSQHILGEAADFTCPAFGNPEKIAKHLSIGMDLLGVDQMILEGTWVHVSFTHKPRYEILTLANGIYLRGLPS